MGRIRFSSKSKDLRKFAKKLGYKAEATAAPHLKFTHPNGAIVYTAWTPSDFRARKNCMKRLIQGAKHGTVISGDQYGK